MGQKDNHIDKHMDEYIKEISEKIDGKRKYYAEISNKIWEYAEPRFQEYKSSELLRQSLKEEGFSVKSGRRGNCIYCRIWLRKTSHRIPWRVRCIAGTFAEGRCDRENPGS